MKRPLCYLCMAFVVTVFIYLKLNPLPETSLVESSGSRVTFLGEVYHKEYKNEKLVLYLKQVKKWDSQNSKVFSYNEDTHNDINIMCYIEDGIEPKLGSEVAVTGNVSEFSTPANPGEFDAKLYYQILELDFQLWEGKIVAQSSSFSIYHEKLYQIRQYFENIFDVVLPEKEASIMKAMVLGNKSELDSDSKLLYQKSGISHILAISGLHISLIGMALYKLFRKVRVPIIISSIISVLIMIAYGDMAGMSSSAFRAIFMFAIKLLADSVHRTYDMLTAVALAAVLLLADQPLYLYHSGFLLSFGAILGLGCFSENLGGSLSVFLIHFPIMLSVYFEFPIYSFLLNLVIIPAMSVLMTLGILCILCGAVPVYAIGMGMAHIMGAGCHALLWVFEMLCELSLALPGANWITGKPDNWRLVCFYMVVLILFILQEYCKYINKKSKYVKKGITIKIPKLLQLMMILAAVILVTSRNYEGLEITFVDVGQGDCIWIQTPEGKHYLIDAGSTSESSVGQYTLLPYLKYMGTDRLDAVFLTHLDSDHTSAITELLENGEEAYKRNGIEIGCIVIAEAVIRDEAYEKLIELCNMCNIQIAYAKTGDVISEDKLKLSILHPEDDYVTESRNAYSLVVKLDYFRENGHFGALFTGDVEADGEQIIAEYLKDKDWSCDLFKASHHGSKNSNTEELLEVIQPQLTVISCAEDNGYGHPHKETLERLKAVGSDVLITKDSGAIMIKVVEDVEICEFKVR